MQHAFRRAPATNGAGGDMRDIGAPYSQSEYIVTTQLPGSEFAGVPLMIIFPFRGYPGTRGTAWGTGNIYIGTQWRPEAVPTSTAAFGIFLPTATRINDEAGFAAQTIDWRLPINNTLMSEPERWAPRLTALQLGAMVIDSVPHEFYGVARFAFALSFDNNPHLFQNLVAGLALLRLHLGVGCGYAWTHAAVGMEVRGWFCMLPLAIADLLESESLTDAVTGNLPFDVTFGASLTTGPIVPSITLQIPLQAAARKVDPYRVGVKVAIPLGEGGE
jgi:hypothetical protein